MFPFFALAHTNNRAAAAAEAAQRAIERSFQRPIAQATFPTAPDCNWTHSSGLMGARPPPQPPTSQWDAPAAPSAPPMGLVAHRKWGKPRGCPVPFSLCPSHKLALQRPRRRRQQTPVESRVSLNLNFHSAATLHLQIGWLAGWQIARACQCKHATATTTTAPAPPPTRGRRPTLQLLFETINS